MVDYEAILEGLKKDHAAAVDALDKAIQSKNTDAISAAESALKEIEEKYATEKECEVIQTLSTAENPVKAAIEMRSYCVASHMAERDNGEIIGVFPFYAKEKPVDLLKVCKRCNLPTEWRFKVQKMNQLLAMRTAKTLGYTPKQIANLGKTFFMSEKARELEMGKTPDSNSQICKLMQEVFDSILFEDNGKGKNKYVALSRDANYLLACYSRRNAKRGLCVSVAKNSYMNTLITDVLYRAVTDGEYTVDYQQIKPKKVSAPKKAEVSDQKKNEETAAA